MERHLYQAIKNHKTFEALALLDDPDVNQWINEPIMYGTETCLYCAVRCGEKVVVRKMLTVKSIEVNKGGYWRLTPLYSAISNKHTDIVELLLTHGAEYNGEPGDSLSPLHLAACRNDTNTLQYLLCKFSQHVNDSCTIPGLTPLHLVASIGNLDATKLFIAYGADTTIITSDGKTPYDEAVENNHEEVANYIKHQTKESHNLVMRVDDLEAQCHNLQANNNQLQSQCNELKTENSDLKARMSNLEQAHSQIYQGGDVSQVNELHKVQRTLQLSHAFAVKHLNPTIRHHLFSEGLVNAMELEHISRRLENKGNEDACDYMLQVLTRSISSIVTFQKFLCALHKDGQHNIVKKYESTYNNMA